ncbi:MAG: methanogenesis marker 5 protein [Methanocalculus sp. MSAO_Arc1]|uniref:methanogenesis marker 5 protein n=1 Tax=Methanocalculus TaxID=71151 RepID=UPI000FF5B64F|nr:MULTISPECIES: methanogenesis marker 5 protein [unclassified Methanocalculus]MCP1662724.1 putative methanogenesis marker protein 5 [Methanocalculus sp. AMF5]RQD79964.1 MAG: methanogenesis marker 5 protein [Methanocalculus sp. MSAO_Arc1]
MAKVFIYPATSLMLSDLVARYGHEPLGSALSVREHIQAGGFDSPPLQITPEDPKVGLHWAAVEVPSGVRGRMALYGPLIESAEAAIIIQEADFAFGCMGCARTNELLIFLLKQKGIPVLDLDYPKTKDEGVSFVAAIKSFLTDLGGEDA